MAIKVERTKVHKMMDDSAAAYVDLTNLHQCVVAPTGAATGNMLVTTPSGQGVYIYAVLLNAPDITEMAELQVYGIAEIRAEEAINAGVEVTVAGANGRIEAAASGDWVIGWSREAALAADHCISVTLCMGYYKP